MSLKEKCKNEPQGKCKNEPHRDASLVIFPRMTSGKHEDDTLEKRMTNKPKDDAQDDISIFWNIL